MGSPLDGARSRAVASSRSCAFRAFLHELLAVDFAEPLLVTVKGTLTGDLITALTRQYEVLDAVDAFRKQSGKPAYNPPFYACSIPLGPGAEVTRGSAGATKEITPIVANIPTPVTKEYVLAHWIKRAWVPTIEELLDDTIAWSVATSTMIGLDEEQPAGAPIEEEPPPPMPVQQAPRGNGRRQPVEDLL